MAIRCERNNDCCVLKVADEMTIYTAAEQLSELQALLAQCAEIELDLSAVSEIDSAGLQLVMMLKTYPGQHVTRVRIGPCSTAVHALLSMLGLTDLLEAQS